MAEGVAGFLVALIGVAVVVFLWVIGKYIAKAINAVRGDDGE